MKVCISLGGRFHAFYLAKYLQEQGCLHHLCTSYPKFEVAKYGIDTKKVSTVVSKELVQRGYRKLMKKELADIYLCDWFDYWASKQLPMDADIYVIWSGFALKTIQQIRKRNPRAIIILERCSTHIQFQFDILNHAYSLFHNVAAKLPSQPIIEKEKAEYQAVDYISVPTNFVRKTFLDKFIPQDKIIVNPYGVLLNEFSYSANKELKPQQEFKVIFVGYFCVRKGAKIFLEIVDYFKHHADITFQLVGSIEIGLEEYIAPYLNKNLYYQSSVPQNKLNNFYAGADVFLFPSYEEGMAYVTLQAMACGLALVVSHNSGAGMAIEHGKSGYLFDSEAKQSYIDTIQSLYEDRGLCRRIGKEARQGVEKGFTWEDYSQRYLQKLQSLNSY
jgi:glycosyltransferase involved in cell wall biosynthesis